MAPGKNSPCHRKAGCQDPLLRTWLERLRATQHSRLVQVYCSCCSSDQCESKVSLQRLLFATQTSLQISASQEGMQHSAYLGTFGKLQEHAMWTCSTPVVISQT